jgi:predicted ester cyclase
MNKLDHLKRFIMIFYTDVFDSDVANFESAVRKYTDNETYIRGVVMYKKAFPDYTIHIEDFTAEGDFVITHGIMKGTHKGEIYNIPATYRKIELPIMVKYHIINDKIIDTWIMFDQMSLFEQLGVLNKPN